MRRRLAGSALAGCAALLAGCAAVGPNFTPPPAPQAQGYAQAGDEANDPRVAIGDQVIADWWTLFRSPTIDALVRQAIANNKTLEATRATLAAAREEVMAQTGLVTADANLAYQRERTNLYSLSGGSFKSTPGLNFETNPDFNLYTVGAAVSYNFDLFGQVRRKKEALKADAEAEARQLDAAYLTLTGQVVMAAVAAADANIQIADLREIIASDKADLDMVTRAQLAGGAALVDIAAIKSNLEQDTAAIPVQEQRLDEARHKLAVLLGKAPSEFDPPNLDGTTQALPASFPIAVPSALVHGRPDILEAEARLHAATARIGVAEAALYPNITLTGSITQLALSPEQLFQPIGSSWVLGPQLTIPVFRDGELTAEKRKAQDEARAALADYQQTVLVAFAQVADALQSIVHGEAGYAAQARALDAAQSRLDMLRRGFKAGGVTALALVDAERDWRRTRLALAAQGAGRFGDAARLLLATAAVPPGAAGAEPESPHATLDR